MQQPYIAPELRLAGAASGIVLGMGHAGYDFFGEYVDQNGGGDFEYDGNEAATYEE